MPSKRADILAVRYGYTQNFDCLLRIFNIIGNSASDIAAINITAINEQKNITKIKPTNYQLKHQKWQQKLYLKKYMVGLMA